MSTGFRQLNFGTHWLHQGQIRKERTDRRFELQLASRFHLGSAADQERWDHHLTLNPWLNLALRDRVAV